MAHPPSYPPPRHLLGSLNAPSGQSSYPNSLVAVNKPATLPSSPPTAPISTTSIHSNSSTAGVDSKSSSSANPPALQLSSATVKKHVSRFQTGRVEIDFGRMKWESSLKFWGRLLSKEIRSYMFPAEHVGSYSNMRGDGIDILQANCNAAMVFTHRKAQCLPLPHQKHCHNCHQNRSSLSIQDWEEVLAMASVCTHDMREELQYFRSFRHDDDLSPYVFPVLEHVKAVLSLRIPFVGDFIFSLVPAWNAVPTDDQWPRSYHNSL